MTINIEITSAPDTALLSAIHCASFGKGWDEQAIASMLSIKGTEAFMAGNKGFGLLRCLGDDAEILTLAVMPDFRRQGVGKAVVAAMAQWARERKAIAVFLEVKQGNAAAQDLYEKAGFKVISRRKDYYQREGGTREDAVVMRLTF